MNNKLINSRLNLDKITHTDNINEIIFIGLVMLCFFGDVIGEVSDHAVILYWLLMTPIFFLGSIIIEKAQTITSTNSIKKSIRFSLIVWGSAFFSVLTILFLWHAESFAAETVGLIIHVILGHTFFISGTVLGFRFYLIGLFLLLLAWFTIAMEATVGMTLILTIPLIFIGLRYKNKVVLPFAKKPLMQ